MVKTIPEKYQNQIDKAVEILKGAGCKEIYVFGSVLDEKSKARDIDIAVNGCPPEKIFRVYSKLIFALDYPVDLVDLDSDNKFTEFLQTEDVLVNVT